jgi:hypothetical protein
MWPFLGGSFVLGSLNVMEVLNEGLVFLIESRGDLMMVDSVFGIKSMSFLLDSLVFGGAKNFSTDSFGVNTLGVVCSAIAIIDFHLSSSFPSYTYLKQLLF